MKRTKNPAKEAEYRKRAADLVAQMTLHEKVSQMLSWACLLYTSDAADE